MSSAACILIALWVVLVSTRDLSNTIARFPATRWAAQLGAMQLSYDRAALADAARTTLRLSDGQCRPASDEAAATLAVADLLSRDQLVDYEGWVRSIARAQFLVRHQLSCAPGDGVAWARLAITERLVSIAPDRLSSLVIRSFRAAPADPVAIASRIALWRSLPASALPAIEPVRDSDLRSVLAQAWPPEAAFLFRSAGPTLAAEIQGVLETLPPRRQAHLRGAGLLAEPGRDRPLTDTIGDTLIRLMSQPRREDLAEPSGASGN